MAGRDKAPARTEADIRAALTELAQRAPSAGAVLTAVRGDLIPAPRRRRG